MADKGGAEGNGEAGEGQTNRNWSMKQKYRAMAQVHAMRAHLKARNGPLMQQASEILNRDAAFKNNQISVAS